MSEPWRHRAACRDRDTNYWFPEKRGANNPATVMAVSICKTKCPVIEQCLKWAMDKPELHGIWGGKTAEERRGMRRQRTSRINHGTHAGYLLHANWGIPYCEPCRKAHTDYTAARRRIRERAKTRHDLEGLP